MPFIPLHDDNPTTHAPVVTVALIGTAVAVFLWQTRLDPTAGDLAALAFGAIPALLFGEASLDAGIARLPAVLTLLTSLFLHGGWLHLGGNMLYLWIFGNNVEDAMGHGRFLVFYLVCGLLATLAHALSDPFSTVPVIGASGAISGVLGAYLLLHPRAKIVVLIVPLVLRLPAWLVLLGWFAMQGISAFAAQADGGGVAWWAHIGGFCAGMVLLMPFRRPGVALLDRDRRPGPRRGPWG
jgi:membrane associated rhomboid family serine protease